MRSLELAEFLQEPAFERCNIAAASVFVTMNEKITFSRGKFTIKRSYKFVREEALRAQTRRQQRNADSLLRCVRRFIHRVEANQLSRLQTSKPACFSPSIPRV